MKVNLTITNVRLFQEENANQFYVFIQSDYYKNDPLRKDEPPNGVIPIYLQFSRQCLQNTAKAKNQATQGLLDATARTNQIQISFIVEESKEIFKNHHEEFKDFIKQTLKERLMSVFNGVDLSTVENIFL